MKIRNFSKSEWMGRRCAEGDKEERILWIGGESEESESCRGRRKGIIIIHRNRRKGCHPHHPAQDDRYRGLEGNRAPFLTYNFGSKVA